MRQLKHIKPKDIVIWLATKTAWLLLWPMIVVVPSGVIFVIVSFIVYFVGGQEWTGIAARILYVAAGLIIASLCFLVAWLIGRSKEPFVRRGKSVLVFYTLVGIVISTGLSVVQPDQFASTTDAGINTQTTQSFDIPPRTMDSVLVSQLDAIGATLRENISINYVESYENQPLKEGEYQSYTNSINGEYAYSDITIKRGLSVANERATVAHEYLHHVWFTTLDDVTKQRLTSDLITIYGGDPQLRQRSKFYSDSGALQPTELFSMYCTESSDVYLTEYILTECGKYIRRSTLTFQR